MSKIQKNIFFSFSVFIAILIAILLITGFKEMELNRTEQFKKDYAIHAIDVPDSLTFAGEHVPLEYFDVKQSLDRELLVNTYWQSSTLLLLKRSKPAFEIIEPILKENGVPDDFKYLAVAESGLLNITSPSGAKGYWQILEGTARDYGLEVNTQIDERYHLEKATRAACDFLKESHDKFGSWAMAAAAYNMGRNALSKQVDRQKDSCYYNLILSDETQRYVFRIIALREILSTPDKFGFHITPNDYYKNIPYHQINIDSTISDIALFAQQHHTNYKIIKTLNPWLRENYLNNNSKKLYTIKLPRENARTKGF